MSTDDGLFDHCSCCAHRRGVGPDPCGGPNCPCSHPVPTDEGRAEDFLLTIDEALRAALLAHHWSATDNETCSCGWVAPMWAEACTGSDDEAEHAAVEVAHAAFLAHQTAAVLAALSVSSEAAWLHCAYRQQAEALIADLRARVSHVEALCEDALPIYELASHMTDRAVPVTALLAAVPSPSAPTGEGTNTP